MKLIPQGWFRVVVRAETKKVSSCRVRPIPYPSFPFSSSPLHLTFPSPLSLSLSSSKRCTSLSLPLSLSMEHETLHDRIKRISLDRRSGRTNKSVERPRLVSFRSVDDCWAAAAIVPSRRRRIGPPWEEFLIYNEFKPTQITRISSFSVFSQPSEWLRIREIFFIVVGLLFIVNSDSILFNLYLDFL